MPFLYVLLASVLFGTTGTAQALGPGGDPATVGAARIAVGGSLLVLAALLARRGRSDAAWPLGAVLAGGIGVAAYQLTFFAAVDDTGVAVGTVVALGSAPALAGLGSRLVDGEPLSGRWAGATALACAGVLVLVLAGGGAAEVSLSGVALALGAGASYATMTIAAKRMLDMGHGSEAVMARTFGLGALLLLPLLALGDSAWMATPDGALLALFLGAVPTAAAYLLFARGLRRLSAGDAATLTLAEPLTATALGIAVLGERPSAMAAVGVLLVLAGLALLGLPRRGRHRRARTAVGARSAPAPVAEAA